MRLSGFIRNSLEDILVTWESFAATLLPAAAGMSSRALRDHARQILEAVADDLESPQTRLEQSEKSMGRAPLVPGAPATAAQTHAVLRARSGFDINQLVAEYRALRASVLRLWMDSHVLEPSDVEDVIRFNEAIDQAITESVSHFNAQVEYARNLLLGMLGHDMRNPLNSMLMTAQMLAGMKGDARLEVAAGRLMRSGAALQVLLDDLVDFNRTNLGMELEIVPTETDLAVPVADEVGQLQSAHPHRRIELVVRGDVRGRWDGRRVQQALRNLVVNAVRYGAPDGCVNVELCGHEAHVTLEVTNAGSAVDPETLAELFHPLRRGLASRGGAGRDGLGLGLYIVREIVTAHGGAVDVKARGDVTVFTVTLPREAAVPGAPA